MTAKIIRLYLGLAFLTRFSMSFIAATYVTFLITRGLNLFEVNLVNCFFFATLTLFEVPTGAIADVFGRKTSFIVSCLLSSFGTFIYALTDSFSGFALAEAVAAVGMTFASGAFQAWLVDSLKHHTYAGSIRDIFAKEQQLTQVAGIGGALIGATLAETNIALPWIVSSVMMSVAGILAWLLMEEKYFVRESYSITQSWNAMKTVMGVGRTYVATNKAVRYVLVFSVWRNLAIQAPNMQWQPFFSQYIPNAMYLGWIFGGISVAFIIGARLSSRFLNTVGRDEKRALALVQVGIGLGIFATIQFQTLPAVLGIFLIHEMARGMFQPIQDMYLNDHIQSKERATLLSFESMAHHIGGMVGLLASGLVAEYVGMREAWTLSGGVLIVATLYLMRNGKA